MKYLILFLLLTGCTKCGGGPGQYEVEYRACQKKCTPYWGKLKFYGYETACYCDLLTKKPEGE